VVNVGLVRALQGKLTDCCPETAFIEIFPCLVQTWVVRKSLDAVKAAPGK
jgi:hypothetical protein